MCPAKWDPLPSWWHRAREDAWSAFLGSPLPGEGSSGEAVMVAWEWSSRADWGLWSEGNKELGDMVRGILLRTYGTRPAAEGTTPSREAEWGRGAAG